jgi:hypothetical protein
MFTIYSVVQTIHHVKYRRHEVALLDPAARRSRTSLALHLGGLFAAVLGFFFVATLAGTIGLVVAYLLSGLRVAQSPYQRYINPGRGLASWVVAAAVGGILRTTVAR